MNWKNKDEPYKTGEFALTTTEVENLLSHCETLFEKILIEVGIATGCRRADLAALEKSNIDLTNMKITYVEKKKGGRIKTANFGDKLRVDLKQYIFTLPSKCKWLFPSKHGYENHISDRTIWNVFNQVCARSGISQRPVHSMRSTFVKQAISKGWTLIQIADHIGDTPETVQKYYAVPSVGEMSEVARDREVI